MNKDWFTWYRSSQCYALMEMENKNVQCILYIIRLYMHDGVMMCVYIYYIYILYIYAHRSDLTAQKSTVPNSKKGFKSINHSNHFFTLFPKPYHLSPPFSLIMVCDINLHQPLTKPFNSFKLKPFLKLPVVWRKI